MITANKLSLLTNLPTVMLNELIREAGYKKDHFLRSQFLGLTNGGEFCYSANFLEDREEKQTKVFVKYDSSLDKITVDY